MKDKAQLTLIKQRSLKQKVKIFLVVASVVLFVFNYQICEYFYPKDVEKWWGLKSNIYAVIIGLVFASASIGVRGVLGLVFNIGLGLTISNIIDKCYFNVLEFRYNDIIMIVLTISFSLLKYLNNQINAK